MHNLQSTGGRARRHRLRDFLARADVLAARRQDRADLRLLRVLPAGRLPGALHQEADRHHDGRPQPAASCSTRSTTTHLDGGILESFGRLFKNDLKLYIYPFLDATTRQLVTVQNLEVSPNLQRLYEHLVENGYIESIDFTTRTTCGSSLAMS